MQKVMKFCFVLISIAFFCSRVYARNIITDVAIDEIDGVTRIAIHFSQKVVYEKPIVLKNPDRLLLDFKQKKVYCREIDSNITRGMVKSVHYKCKDSKLKDKRLLHIVFELHRRAEVVVDKKKKVINILLSSTKQSGAAAKVTPIVPSINTKPKDIKSCLQYALAANPRIAVASDEIKLARLKIRETLRALFPAIKAKYEETEGDAERETGTPDFSEKTYGVQLSQPLYQGRKLWATYRQARFNLDVFELKYEELVSDIVFEVTSAYYNLVKARKTLDIYNQLAGSIGKDISSSRKRHQLKLSTKIEYLTVENQKEQIDYSTVSYEKDLQLARLNLAQELFLTDETSLDIDLILPFSEIQVQLKEILIFASVNRHNKQIAEIELRLKEMGRIIGRSSNALKVDISGFAGKSGGAYESENLKMGEDYSVGIKVSKPFGGNTINSSYLVDKTSPKLGQSTRTQSKAGSVSLSLLDNIKGYSDRLESEIEYEKARIKLIEEITRVKKDVQESYFNLQKAILQVKAGKGDAALAKRQVVATRSKKEHNLAQISELISAKIKQAEAKKSLAEALSFFNISLASLNRAVGKTDKFVIQ